jgi:Kef-type K+ transport system membrane component KefB
VAHDSIAQLLLWLALVLASAKLGGELAVRARQPAVLGELIAGIVLGNLPVAGVHALVPLVHEPGIDLLARLGLIVLLFQVGLASTIREMLRVGFASLAVAVVGVTAATALGFAATFALSHDLMRALFFGAAIAATSIGITARVLADLGRTDTPAGRTILGAAVIDDVLGLIVLAIAQAIVIGAAAGRAPTAATILLVVGKAALFLVGGLALAAALAHPLLRAVARLRGPGALFAASLSACFVACFAADRFGLSPIIGAFAAGLVLAEPSQHIFRAAGVRSLRDMMQPIGEFLVPVFFVVIGMHTDLAAFASPRALALAALLTAAALAGKAACALVVPQKVGRFAVVAGMWPRGEVMLVFAALGAGLTVGGAPLVDRDGYAALLLVVLVTTLVTPPALRAAFKR